MLHASHILVKQGTEHSRLKLLEREKKMPSLHPLPHTLAPYLTHSTHSPQSLTLITSVLATTPNWLLLRYLYSVLSDSTTSTDDDDDDDEDYDGYNARNQEENNKPQGLKGRRRRRGRTARRIVFVSFMRNWSFWRGESKRLVCFILSISFCALFCATIGMNFLIEGFALTFVVLLVN